MQRLRFKHCSIETNRAYPFTGEYREQRHKAWLGLGWTPDQVEKKERYDSRLNGPNASPEYAYVGLETKGSSEEIGSGDSVKSCLIDILVTSDNRIHFDVQVNYDKEKELRFEVDPQTLRAYILSSFGEVIQEFKFA